MSSFTPQIIFFLETILFTTVILMHISRKNSTVVFLYGLQSFIISFSLLYSSLSKIPNLLTMVALITFIIKVLIAPYFFNGLINKHTLQFSASTYLNGPMTLIVLALLTAFSYSHYFESLALFSPYNENALHLAIGMLFISIFLIVNRKSVLSQMIGVLSIENAIVSFAFVAKLEAHAATQIGILFDILVWVIISTVFASMMYEHFGTHDTSLMRHLKEK